MIVWIIYGVYILGYIACWRTVCWFVVTDLAFGSIDGEALVLGIVLGMLATLLWPLIAVGIGVRKVYAIRGQEVTSLVIPRAAKRRVRFEAQAARIAELERELGFDDWETRWRIRLTRWTSARIQIENSR